MLCGAVDSPPTVATLSWKFPDQRWMGLHWKAIIVSMCRITRHDTWRASTLQNVWDVMVSVFQLEFSPPPPLQAVWNEVSLLPGAYHGQRHDSKEQGACLCVSMTILCVRERVSGRVRVWHVFLCSSSFQNRLFFVWL